MDGEFRALPETRGDVRDLLKLAFFAGVEAAGSPHIALDLWVESPLRNEFDADTMRLIHEGDAK